MTNLCRLNSSSASTHVGCSMQIVLGLGVLLNVILAVLLVFTFPSLDDLHNLSALVGQVARCLAEEALGESSQDYGYK